MYFMWNIVFSGMRIYCCVDSYWLLIINFEVSGNIYEYFINGYLIFYKLIE